MSRKQLLTLGFALSSVAPMGMASLHQGLLTTAEAIALTSLIAVSVFLLLKTQWTSEGLYGYVRKVSPLAGKVQLASWIGSYFLYLSYTLDYITYWLLNLEGSYFYLATLGLAAMVLVLILTDYDYHSLLVLGIGQILLSLPLGWRFHPVTNFSPLNFSAPLSSALLIVCITLIPFSRPAKPSYALYSFLVASGLMVSGSLFLPPSYFTPLGSLSALALVIAEFVSLKGLFKEGLKSSRWFRLVLLLFVVTVLIGLPFPSTYYQLTIAPSVTLLYFTLTITFLTSIFLIRRIVPSVVFLGAGALALYGLYSTLVSSSTLQLWLDIAALVASTVVPLSIKPILAKLFKS